VESLQASGTEAYGTTVMLKVLALAVSAVNAALPIGGATESAL